MTREEIIREANYLERRDIDFLFEEMVLYYKKPSIFKFIFCNLELHGSTKHLRFNRSEFIHKKLNKYGYKSHDNNELCYICTSCKKEWTKRKRNK